jgi:hypothetical protein
MEEKILVSMAIATVLATMWQKFKEMKRPLVGEELARLPMHIVMDGGRNVIFVTLVFLLLVGILNVTGVIPTLEAIAENGRVMSSSTEERVQNNSNLRPSTNPKPPTTTNTPVNIANPTTISCKIHENCGGGSKETTKEECDNLTCCTYSLEDPPILTSKSDCQARIDRYKQQAYPAYTWDGYLDSDYDHAPTYTNNTESNNAEKYAECIFPLSASYANKQEECNSLPYTDQRIIDSCLYQAKTAYAREKDACYQMYPH